MTDFDYSLADRLMFILPRSEAKAATYAALAHELYGTPVHAPQGAEEARKRRSAIRACQQAVEVLRRRGEPVCGGDSGMWLATTSAEVFSEYRRLRRRAIGQLVNAAPLKKRAFAMRAAEQGIRVEPEPEQPTLGLDVAA